MITGLLSQLESYYGEVEANHHDVTPDRVLGYLDRVREVPAPAPVPVRSRSRAWVAVGAAAVVLLLIGLVPILVGSVTDDSPPATHSTVPSTTLPPPTTLPSGPATTLPDAASATVDPVPLEELLDTSINATGRYWQAPASPIFGDDSPEGNAGSWWQRVMQDVGWRPEGRIETLRATLVAAPETRLDGLVKVWLYRFVDDESAAAFVDAFVTHDGWNGPIVVGRGGMQPTFADPFSVPPIGDEAFGFYGRFDDDFVGSHAFAAVAGARSGTVVAIVRVSMEYNTTNNGSLYSEADVAIEATYLTDAIFAVLRHEPTPTTPASAGPFSEDEEAAIAAVERFHQALTDADFDAIWSTVQRQHPYDLTKNRLEAFIEAGAVFEATYCRPTVVASILSNGTTRQEITIFCLAGYRLANSESIDFRRFVYEDGRLQQPGHYRDQLGENP